MFDLRYQGRLVDGHTSDGSENAEHELPLLGRGRHAHSLLVDCESLCCGGSIEEIIGRRERREEVYSVSICEEGSVLVELGHSEWQTTLKKRIVGLDKLTVGSREAGGAETDRREAEAFRPTTTGVSAHERGGCSLH